MSSELLIAGGASPYRATAYQPGPNNDPNLMIRVVEALTRKRQSELEWEKLVPHRLACMKKVLRDSWFTIIVGPVLTGFMWTYVLRHIAVYTCRYGLSVLQVRLMAIGTLLWVLYSITLFPRTMFRRETARIFDYEQRWHREGYRTQFVARELRLRFQKIEALLKLQLTEHDPEHVTTPEVRAAMQEWLTWLDQPLGAAYYIALSERLHDEAETAARSSRKLVKLVERLDQLYQSCLSPKRWEFLAVSLGLVQCAEVIDRLEEKTWLAE